MYRQNFIRGYSGSIDRVPMSLINSKGHRNKPRSLLNLPIDAILKLNEVEKVSTTKPKVAETVPSSYTLPLRSAPQVLTQQERLIKHTVKVNNVTE